ncbi:HAMP domain-containing sensor histidine kinase [Pseudoalteromonas aurantia]|uniref:histidine kinase n=1 Tax=Pseudoalteromonas aurantia 208 TaxID=1314867 RepID=A0ABR9EIC4_9GAMM|nr:HAMP domain-containing sensor histidine kinase [Pseudoalteromonas aurantia]MBE0370750.1 two-component system, NtrC family, sensor histidine kinase GlrK [Pseudoalteromonas aurantia 208]
MTIDRLKKQVAPPFIKLKKSQENFFSRSLGFQAKLALAVALIPIIALTIWYANHVSSEQQRMHQAYVNNHQLILEFSSLKEDISALEKAQKNNHLLNSPALQNSIENKWKMTHKRIILLKNAIVETALVANWQQVLSLVPIYDSHLVSYKDLHNQLSTTEKLFHQALAMRLAAKRANISYANHWFVALLLILLPVFIMISLALIHRVTQQLYKVEHTLSRLGDGKYSGEIELHGSNELSKLGQKLSWLNDELQRSHAQKDSFLRHVSHELKTPLSSLSEGNSLLQSDDIGILNLQQQRIVTIMGTSLTRLNILIDDLLNYSAASHPLHQQKRKALNSLALDLQTQFGTHSLSHTKHIDWQISDSTEGLPYMPCKLILIQLINNALQYAKHKVQVSLSVQNHIATFSIVDDGVGIESSELAQLMQPFFRGQHSHSHSGSGLGLAIVEESVKQLKGNIQFNNVESGTHICVQFPVEGSQ